jgi:hypothetical protein
VVILDAGVLEVITVGNNGIRKLRKFEFKKNFILRREEIYMITDVLSDIRGVVRNCEVLYI